MELEREEKLSSAFLLNTPIFSEVIAALLCVPNPVCRDRVGEMIGRSRLDHYGDKIVGQNLTGGGWTRRHDTVKSELNSCRSWAGIDSVC